MATKTKPKPGTDAWRKTQQGKIERARTAAGRARLDYGDIYGAAASDFRLNEQEFRFKVVRPDLGNIWIDGLVTDANWNDDGGPSFNNPITLTGAVSLRVPVDRSLYDTRIEDGHVVECYVKWPGFTKPSEGGIGEPGYMLLWAMRIQNQERDVGEGNWSLTLADDTQLLYKSRDDWKFRKTKKGRYKRGWRTDEIVKYVAKRYRFPVKMIRGKHYVKAKEFKDESPMNVILWAIKQEYRKTGKYMIVRWERGKLVIALARRNPLLYTFGDYLTSANVSRSNPAMSGLATVMTVRFVPKKKRKGKTKAQAKKGVLRYANRKLMQRYGYIHKPYKAPAGVDSRAEAKSWAAGVMREKGIRVPTVTFSHPGIAMIRRGDAIRLSIPEEGFAGVKKGSTGVAFVQSVQHQLSSGDYRMEVTLSFKDMLDPEIVKRQQDAEKRAAAAAKRDSSATESSGSSGGGSGTLYDEAKRISDATTGYLLGGGHGPALSTLTSSQKLDCSSSCSLALKRANMFPGEVAIVSGTFASSWGKDGRGDDYTVWANANHVFIQSEGSSKWRFDTGGPGGGNGPKLHLNHRPTSGFTPRKWSP